MVLTSRPASSPALGEIGDLAGSDDGAALAIGHDLLAGGRQMLIVRPRNLCITSWSSGESDPAAPTNPHATQ
jgi:hypothetical protein